MIFNSIEFLLFFVAFFVLYWFACGKKIRIQNLLLLAGSYVFYAWWDWRFLLLLIFSSGVFFFIGKYLHESTDEKKRRILKYCGVSYGLLTLGYFKYTNFFITSLTDAFASFGVHLDIHTLSIILPLGISFYTFRMLSYLLDIDNLKIKPCTDGVVFFLYVAFFPSLISGPIDRSKLLIPQLEKKRIFEADQAFDGLRQILWGLFKKIVIANNLAETTQQIFSNYENLPTDTLILGAFYYTIQLYADFSGYSDMAIGIARLLGFKITKNFNYPFFSHNIAQYWRNWHISLTSWLTDYVFTPLSIRFRDYGKWGLILAIIINFILVGIWHGANWTFVLFGFLNGCYFIPLIIRGTMTKTKKQKSTSPLFVLRGYMNMLATFVLVMFTNILFRSENITSAWTYIKHIVYEPPLSNESVLKFFHVTDFYLIPKELCVLILIVFFMSLEWIGKEQDHALARLGLTWKKPLRWMFYYLLVFIVFFFAGDKQEFIYFQF